MTHATTMAAPTGMDMCPIMPTYGPPSVSFVRGEGARLWDVEGNEYLDFLAGIAVCSLGHSHPGVADAIAEQARTLLHVSNLYGNEHAWHVAATLDRLIRSGHPGGGEPGQVYFGNSGAEANEAALKLARKWGGRGRHTVITAMRSFHGRTLGTLAATGQPEKQEPFQPLPEGFKHVVLNDLDEMERMLDDTVAAVLLEPIQGEGGVNALEPGYLAAVREMTAERGILLMMDEIQMGLGRCGEWFAHHHDGVAVDVVTVAKALGNGVPIGACWGAARGRAGVQARRTRVDVRWSAAGHRRRPGHLAHSRRDGRARGCHRNRCGPHRAARSLAVVRPRPRPRVVARSRDQRGRACGPHRSGGRRAAHGGRSRGRRIGPRCAPFGTSADRQRGRGGRSGRHHGQGDRRSVVTRHFLEVDDLSREELDAVLDLAEADLPPQVLDGKGMALLFQKPSARTRNSMEMAVVQLGGHPVTIRPDEVGLDVRESTEDVARTLACYHAAIGARVFEHAKVERMASVVDVPVVNMLSDEAHPLQALADLLTIRQALGGLAGRSVAYVGDANNVARSLAIACGMADMTFRIAAPVGYQFSDADLDRIRTSGIDPLVTDIPAEAVAGADVVYTDVWTSMGQEEEQQQRLDAFANYTIDDEIMGGAADGGIFLHCLPAHPGEEVTRQVLDSSASWIWKQAENRMHAARGLLAWILEA